MSKELGWNPSFDEGVRLLAKHGGLTGIRVNLLTPSEYNSPAAESYFNFYLGFHQFAGEKSGQQVESGISYSSKGWQAFINSGGKETASKNITVGKGEMLRLELSFEGKMLKLMVGATPLFSPVNFHSGAPKMVVALHESHLDLSNRNVWFDKAQMICYEIKIGNQWKSMTSQKIQFVPSIIDKKLINSIITASSIEATMKRP